MSGMEMLMKSFGVDPASIKKQVQEAGDDFKMVVKHFDERLNKIENTIKQINDNQLKIIACLKIEGMIAHDDAQLSVPIVQSVPANAASNEG